MKTKNLIISLFITFNILLQFSNINKLQSQCQPYIKIDGNMVLANQTITAGLALPFWLKENQTLEVFQMVKSISVIEFTENNNSLEYSRVISIDANSTPSECTVPVGKVWKIESISKTPSLSSSNGAVFSGAGSYTLTIPDCASYICIEAWGSGGGGGGCNSSYYYGGGGGGGGYGQGCFAVSPSTDLFITIGSAGVTTYNADGGNASPTTIIGGGINISVAGGFGGQKSSSGGAGGAGGSVITGTSVQVAGSYGVTYGNGGAAGGSPTSMGGHGGSLGNKTAIINDAAIPGGGGGGMFYSSGQINGGAAAPGRVIVTW